MKKRVDTYEKAQLAPVIDEVAVGVYRIRLRQILLNKLDNIWHLNLGLIVHIVDVSR